MFTVDPSFISRLQVEHSDLYRIKTLYRIVTFLIETFF